MAGDHDAVYPDSRETRVEPKIFENGGYIFGCGGSIRMSQLLQYKFEPPCYPWSDSDMTPHRFMCTKFVDAMRSCFATNGFTNTSSILVGFDDQLFIIECDFNVGSFPDGLTAIGDGKPWAIGSLMTWKRYADDSVDVKDALQYAVHMSSLYSHRVGPGKVTILNTKGNKGNK